MKLHPIQLQLLEHVKDSSLLGMSLREIGAMLEIDHPQKVKYHLEQLQKKGHINISSSGEMTYIADEKSPETTYIPLYTQAQCGPSDLFVEENIEKMIPFSSQIFGIPASENLFFVQAKGASMYPKILEGDLVLVHSQPAVKNDEIALVLLNETLQIKQFMRIDNQTVALKSCNPEFRTQIIHEDNNEIHILGLVKKVVSSL